jgi:antitoxin component YwqK of YwqJK toxin-antitoxin module
MSFRDRLISLFTLVSSLAFSQAYELNGKDTINRVDAAGKKQGKWIYFGRHRPGSCQKPDQKAEEGRFTDNKKTGIWNEYHCNGNLKSRLTFVNGKPDGYCWIYHENGKIMEEGVWKNSRWVGKYKLYYDNGQVQHEFSFNESGRRDGPQKYFHENGEIAIEGTFANGRESGIIKEYYENGELRVEKNFNNGNVDLASIKEYQPKLPMPVKSADPAESVKPIKVQEDERPNEAVVKSSKGPIVLNGHYTLYNKNKQISKDGDFKDNRFIEGKAYFYDENGILQRIAVYRNGLYVGDSQIED